MTSRPDPVPTIDIAAPTSSMLGALDVAAADHGFFLLTGHGLDDLVADTWRHARAFFDAERATKSAVMRDQENPFGYFDRELTKRRRDHKEVFDFADPCMERSDARNRWPVEPDGFRDAMVRFFDAFSDLASRTTSLVHLALGLDAATVRSHDGDRTTSSVRLNHYTIGDPVPENERDGLLDLGDTALGHHTDPGVLTLLLQDGTGGLQARGTDGAWIDVEPRPGTIVVNLGDVMQVWTNDRYQAAVHRVLPMTTSDRLSIPYFLNPRRDARIAPIPALAGSTPRYRAFTWRDYMQARTEDNYQDLGVDDTQISDYAVVG